MKILNSGIIIQSGCNEQPIIGTKNILSFSILYFVHKVNNRVVILKKWGERMSLAENIRMFREKANKNQKELAEEVGVTQQMISLYEQNVKVPSLAVAVRIAQALGTTCEKLAGMDKAV